MLDFKKLLDIKYILSQSSDYDFKYLVPLFIIFSLTIIAAFTTWYILRRKESFFKPLANLILKYGLTVGLFGNLLVFLRFESLPFLSIRLWIMFWILIGVIWGLFVGIYTIRYIPSARDQFYKKNIFEKYLPKRRK